MNTIILADAYSRIARMGGTGGYYAFDWTYILVLVGALISIVASSKVTSTFKRYSRIAASSGLTGAQVAQQMLSSAGIYNVNIKHIKGDLTDNFNPSTMTLNLSDPVHSSSSVAAIAVAAHECGHAIQHNEGYEPMIIRAKLVPVANFGSRFGIYIILAGVILSWFQPLITVGIVLFSFGMLFQIVTLPVEFDASKRALEILSSSGVLTGQENDGASKVLRAAALTYVASAAASILSLMRLILLFGGRNRRD